MILDTTKGKVVIEMRPDLAPGHVARIKELVREGFYDGIVFHRVIDGFMAQTGCPQGTGTGGSGKKLKAEFNREKHVRGTVSMARAQNPEFRRQPVLHLLRRRGVPQRPIHRLGQGDGRHGERRQDQARRAGAATPTRSYRPRWRRTLRRLTLGREYLTTNRTTLMTIPSGSRAGAAPPRTPRLPGRTIHARVRQIGQWTRAKKTGVAWKLSRSATMPVGMSRPVSGHRTMTAPIWPLPALIVGLQRLIAATCEDCLTRWRPYRDEFIEKAAPHLRDLYRAKCACRRGTGGGPARCVVELLTEGDIMPRPLSAITRSPATFIPGALQRRYVVVASRTHGSSISTAEEFGPYQSEREAMLFAIDAAHKLGEQGAATQVLLRRRERRCAERPGPTGATRTRRDRSGPNARCFRRYSSHDLTGMPLYEGACAPTCSTSMLPPERIALRPAVAARCGAASGRAARRHPGIRRSRRARSPRFAAARRCARGQRHQGHPGATHRPAHRARRDGTRHRGDAAPAPRRLALARLRQAGEAAVAGRRRALRRRGQGLLPRPARRHGGGEGRGRRGDACLRVPRPGARPGGRGARRDAAAALYRGAARAGRARPDDYQTMFAHDEGSVAAPTAGLHFTDALARAPARRAALRSTR